MAKKDSLLGNAESIAKIQLTSSLVPGAQIKLMKAIALLEIAKALSGIRRELAAISRKLEPPKQHKK
jgi:hypothetical protein